MQKRNDIPNACRKVEGNKVIEIDKCDGWSCQHYNTAREFTGSSGLLVWLVWLVTESGKPDFYCAAMQLALMQTHAHTGSNAASLCGWSECM